MSHYYTDNSNLKSEQKTFEYIFDNEVFNFTTDNGVFCKGHVDYGSYLLLKTVKSLVLGDKILDLGCGFGPIGIIIKRLNPNADLTLVDINSRAIELANINAKINQVSLNIYQCSNILELTTSFNTVLLNPPIRAGKSVIYDLYKKAYQKLLSGGKLYIVIQKKQGANSSVVKLKELFSEVVVLDKEAGYWIIEARK